jgi:hypothetical protein
MFKPSAFGQNIEEPQQVEPQPQPEPTLMDDVIDWFGSRAIIAKTFGVSRAAVTQWCQSGMFPAMRAIQIEQLSEGRFKALDLMGCS